MISHLFSMNITPEFQGEVKDGKLVIRHRDDFMKWISHLKGEVRIIVEKIRGKRSDNQNRFYWACLKIISNETGNTEDDLHRIFKAKFLPKRKVKFGKNEYNLPISTTSLNKIEFAEYFERISAEAGELGITLPDPNDYYKKYDPA